MYLGTELTCGNGCSRILVLRIPRAPSLNQAGSSRRKNSRLWLLKTAARDQDPIIYFEHTGLYAIKIPVPEGDYLISFGETDIRKSGKNVTIGAVAAVVRKALDAARNPRHVDNADFAWWSTGPRYTKRF